MTLTCTFPDPGEDFNTCRAASSTTSILDATTLQPMASSTMKPPIQWEKECKTYFSASKPEDLICRKRTNKQKNQNQKDSGHCDTLMLSWKDHAKAEQNFLPGFCASSELVFVFPRKSHFYINRPEQRGIGKLTQSPPRTKDDTGVTCLPLQKNVIYKRQRGKQRKY